MKCGELLSLALAATLSVTAAEASAPGVFGFGPRSAALAGSDVADPDPEASPQQNPAGAASSMGARLALGYGRASMDLTIDGRDAGVRPVSGVDLAVQYGSPLGSAFGEPVRGGLAFAAHFPDDTLGRVSFRPATEPQMVRYEASLQRTTFDLVGALGVGPIAVGGGASVSLDLAGGGSRFTLGQDAYGTYADAETDIALPYRVAPLVGVIADLGRAKLSATFRGALAVDLRLESESAIALTDNPLNGDTTILVRGSSGYDPAVLAVGTKVLIWKGFSAFASLDLAFYSAAPPPVADVVLDVRLGTVPSQREAHFVEPRFRDTLSPHFGVEMTWPEARDLSLRLGYSVSPSPVPAQKGFTSYADATRHQASLGSGVSLGRLVGVDLALQGAFGLALLAPRSEQKANASLPHSSYEVGGRVAYGSAMLQATWR